VANSTFCSDFGWFSGWETVVSGAADSVVGWLGVSAATGGVGGTRLGDCSGIAGATTFGTGAFPVISGRVGDSEGLAGWGS